jgi:hypothetical protein
MGDWGVALHETNVGSVTAERIVFNWGVSKIYVNDEDLVKIMAFI